MKKIVLMITVMAALLASCGYNNPIDKDVSDDLDEIKITPSRVELYLDTKLPELTVIRIPSYARDTIITWTSSHPELVQVDEVTGKMTILEREPTDVTITATSRDGGFKSSCVLTLRMITTPMEYYTPMNLTDDFGLWILDLAVRECTPGFRDHFFQWGRSIGCRTGEKDMTGINLWKADSLHPDFMDWRKPENTPCPQGWRVPTKAELELIGSKIHKDETMDYDAQRRAEVMFQKLKIISTDYWTCGGYTYADGRVHPGPGLFDVWWDFKDWYWYSSERVAPKDQEGEWPQIYALHITSSGTAKMVKRSVRYGNRMRCVK